MAALAVIGLFACRPTAKPDDQSRGQLEIPQFPKASSGGFDLTDLTSMSRHFSGWLLLWDKNANREDMAEVLNASINFHRSYAQYLAFFSREVTPLRREKADLKAAIQTLITDNNHELKAARTTAASSWFTETLQSASLLDEEDRQNAQQKFSLFCDAKIWEFATTKENLQRAFIDRPTPAILCEGYYSQQGYFNPSAPSCAATHSGSNFFSCLWREGVLRTPLFARIRDSLALINLEDQVVENALLTSLISQSILRQSRVVRIAQRNFDFSFPDMKVISDPSGTVNLSELAVSGIRQAFTLERQSDITNDGCRLITLSKPRSQESLTAIEQLRADLRVMSGDLDDAVFNLTLSDNTDSDASATTVLTANQNPRQQCLDQGGSGSLCGILNSNNTSRDGEIKRLQDRLKEIDSKTIVLSDATNAPCGDDAISESLQCKQQKASLRLSESVTKPGVAVIVLPLQRFGINFHSLDAGESSVQIEFTQVKQNITPVVGCIESSGTEQACPRLQLNSDKTLPLKVQRDALKSVSLGFSLAVPLAEIGLSYQPFMGDRHLPEIVSVGDSDLKGKWFKAELFPRRWENVLDALMGEVSVASSEGARKEYQGVALLMDSEVTPENVP